MKIVVKADGVFCTSDIDAGAGLGSWDNAGGDAWGGGKDPLNENTTNPTYLWSSDFQVSLNGHDDWCTLTNTEWNYLLSHSTYGTATETLSVWCARLTKVFVTLSFLRDC